MNRKKLAIVALALIFCISVASAVVWLLTVKVPVVYEEPLEIWFSDETTTEWYRLELGQEHTLPAVNLTSRTFETCNNATNNGKRDVLLTVNITAYNKTSGEITNLIGFNVTGEGLNLEEWGTIEFSGIIPAGETVSVTVTYLLSNNAPYPDPGDFEIVWQLFRSEP